MKKTIFMEKYPIYTLEVNKSELKQKNVSEIIDFYKNKIESHPVAKLIAIFDHYEHTKSVNGEINEEILDMQNIIFCFGTAIPDTKIAAVRPRSIGVSELKDKFMIEFMEVPKEELNTLMQSWTKEIVCK